MTPISRKIRVSYDRLVSAYVARNDAETPPKLLPLLHQLADATGRCGQILDVGCGTGREMAWFESQGVRMCGIDLSVGMLTHARTKVQGGLLAMDMTAMAFRDASFDGAWCCASLLHLPKADAKRALAEIRRVLTVDGMFVLLVQEGSGEGWEESYVANSPRYFARYGASELTQILDEGGFNVKHVATLSGRDCTWLASVCTRT